MNAAFMPLKKFKSGVSNRGKLELTGLRNTKV